MSEAVEGQSPPGRLSRSASRGQGDITQDLMPLTTSPLSSLSCSPHPKQRSNLSSRPRRRMSLHLTPLYGAFPTQTGKGFFTEGRVGSSSRKNTDLLPARASAEARLRAASVKLMLQPSIKEALTSLNYTWSEIKYAGLFERNNATAGWHGHVIFSVLL